MYDDDIFSDLLDAPVTEERAREIMACRLTAQAMDTVALAANGLQWLVEREGSLDSSEARSAIEGAVSALSQAYRDLDRSLSLN